MAHEIGGTRLYLIRTPADAHGRGGSEPKSAILHFFVTFCVIQDLLPAAARVVAATPS
jgi:hypothetical protein